MPKVVNHEERRTTIGRAMARLIEREGIHAVSVRSVAAEAGLGPSTLRHYFPSSEEMLAYTIALVCSDQEVRLSAAEQTGNARGSIRSAWLQALPLDAARRTETHVWLAVTAVARTENLRRVLAEINAGLDHLCQLTVRTYAPVADQDVEVRLLRAFTDGLALNAVIDPAGFSPGRTREALDVYLQRLSALASVGPRD